MKIIHRSLNRKMAAIPRHRIAKAEPLVSLMVSRVEDIRPLDSLAASKMEDIRLLASSAAR